MKFSREEKDKAEEYFNDVPWWLTEESVEDKAVPGGVWGLSTVGDIFPALLVSSVPVIICGVLAHVFFGVWVAVAVMVAMTLIMILWPLRKFKNSRSHMYEVEKRYVYIDSFYRSPSDRVEYVTTLKTIGVLNTTVLEKKYKPLKLDNHMNSFNRLADVGDGK